VANSHNKNQMATPFKGLLKCGHCGGSMGLSYTQKKDRRYIYYICETDAKRAISECPVKRVPAGNIEHMVLKYLSEIFQKPSLIAKTYFQALEIEKTEKSRLLHRREELLAEHEKLREQTIEAIQNSNGDNQDGIKSARDSFEQVTRAISEVDTALEVFNSTPISNEDIVKTFASIDVLWNELFPVERYRLLHLLIEKITISTDGIRMELKTSGLGNLIGELMEPENTEAV
jgi:site-specific DNA recombinase